MTPFLKKQLTILVVNMEQKCILSVCKFCKWDSFCVMISLLHQHRTNSETTSEVNWKNKTFCFIFLFAVCRQHNHDVHLYSGWYAKKTVIIQGKLSCRLFPRKSIALWVSTFSSLVKVMGSSALELTKNKNYNYVFCSSCLLHLERRDSSIIQHQHQQPTSSVIREIESLLQLKAMQWNGVPRTLQ